MSLGYEKEDKKKIAILSGLCESIKETGTVIFAAHSNHHSKVAYPASFKSVIGIKYVEGLKKNVMIDFNNRNIILSTDCVCISKIGSNYVRKGNSYLCPFISGVYGSFLQQGLVKNIDNFLSKEKKEYLQKIYLCKDMILNNLIPRHKKLAYYTNKVDENNIKHFNYLSSKVNHILLITDINKLNELETGSCVFIGQCNISLYEYYKLKELVTNIRYNKVNIVMMYPIFNAIERLQFMKEIDAIYSLYI